MFKIFLSSLGRKCQEIIVGAQNQQNTPIQIAGTYLLNDERIAAKPNIPTYLLRLANQDFYIFNDGSKGGWKIGTFESLSTGEYLFKGKFIIFFK